MLSEIFLNQQFLFILSIGILGLLIGSFLNVVIYRLPIMLQQDWRLQSLEILELSESNPDIHKEFNLVTPRSHCPSCKNPLRIIDNIPVLSYLVLRGKCHYCKHPISLRYPCIEISCCLLSVIIAWHFGISWQTVTGLILTWSLLCLTWIDLDYQLLPDSMTLPLVWLGLINSIFTIYINSQDAILGAVIGYLSLWSVATLFKIMTGKIGMGNGDFKLLAVFGAWLGWKTLPFIIFFASFGGACIGIFLIIFKNHQRNTPIPFGPYLALAGWLALLWGEPITQAYLHFLIR